MYEIFVRNLAFSRIYIKSYMSNLVSSIHMYTTICIINFNSILF